jgi:DNA-binding MarR family transcriptional regulator
MKPKQETLGFLLAGVARQMRRAFQQRLIDTPLTLAQARALVYVSRHQGVRQVELAQLLEVQPMTLVRLLDQLESSGLIERRTDAGDRRAYHVYLTPAARPHLATIERITAAVQSQALRDLDKTEMATVFRALNKIGANLAER